MVNTSCTLVGHRDGVLEVRREPPSEVITLHPSSSSRRPGPPAFTIGSIAKTIPHLQLGPRRARPVVGDLRLLVHRSPDARGRPTSRTTEKPAASATCWTARPTSWRRLPTVSCSMPAYRLASVTSIRRPAACADLRERAREDLRRIRQAVVAVRAVR